MGAALNVLILEDAADDAFLIIHVLRQAGMILTWDRVETAEAFEHQLAHPWDVIIADYTLPQFDAPTALKMVQDRRLDIPFIVVTGSIGEQLAVEMMKAGAHDYLMKGNLTRLPEAIKREVRDAQIRSKRRQAELIAQRRLAAIEAAIDAIAIIQNNTYLYVNQAHLQLFGYEHPEDLLGQPWQHLYSPTEVQRFEQDILPLLRKNRAWQGEAIATRKDGSTFAQGVSLTLTDDGLLISVCRDISELKQAQALITHNALHDPLTNLPNRTQLIERLQLAIDRANRSKNSNYAVLFLDLNRFKVINDSLGHMIGDQLLITVAAKLKSQIRKIDLVARLGGDEFVILLEDIQDTDAVVQVVERILEDCQTPLSIKGHQIFISLSIGIALSTETYTQASDLIRDADIAMYQAKARADNTYTFFNSDMHAQVLERLTLETELRRAIDNKEFVVYYQPIFNLKNQELFGFEALLRWQHPTRGILTPNDFVLLAEETGLVAHLDRWVYAQACQQLATWKKYFPQAQSWKISVNLSVQEFRVACLLEDVDKTLSQTGLDGQFSILEITESMLIEDVNKTIDILNQLKSRNIHICIDDFGTGYSSLSYLHRLPISHLKIDRSFVRHLQTEQRNHQIVNTIVTLSKQLGFTTVAEGIETKHQLQWLRGLGCQLGQGYLLSHPLPAAVLEQTLLSKA